MVQHDPGLAVPNRPILPQCSSGSGHRCGLLWPFVVVALVVVTRVPNGSVLKGVSSTLLCVNTAVPGRKVPDDLCLGLRVVGLPAALQATAVRGLTLVDLLRCDLLCVFTGPPSRKSREPIEGFVGFQGLRV